MAPVTAEIAKQMSLPENLTGVLIVQVQPGSAAEKAGLKAGATPYTINGQSVMIGGDIITAIQGQSISTLEDLRNELSQYNPGQAVTLSILRNNEPVDVAVTLGTRPNE